MTITIILQALSWAVAICWYLADRSPASCLSCTAKKLVASEQCL